MFGFLTNPCYLLGLQGDVIEGRQSTAFTFLVIKVLTRKRINLGEINMKLVSNKFAYAAIIFVLILRFGIVFIFYPEPVEGLF